MVVEIVQLRFCSENAFMEGCDVEPTDCVLRTGCRTIDTETCIRIGALHVGLFISYHSL
jgi:hypothetical protein